MPKKRQRLFFQPLQAIPLATYVGLNTAGSCEEGRGGNIGGPESEPSAGDQACEFFSIDAVIRGLALPSRDLMKTVVCVCRMPQHVFCGRQQEEVPWRFILSSVPQRHWHPCANLAPSSVASAWMPKWKMGMFNSAVQIASQSPTSVASQNQKNVRSVGRASPRKLPAHQKGHWTTCSILQAKKPALLMTRALHEQMPRGAAAKKRRCLFFGHILIWL